jgi:class 3 adenylate cyclase/tetratricopeptide (TPR) repeat protein
MKCSRCSQDNPAGARFCLACGERLEAACPACGFANAAAGRFCTECGAPLAPATARFGAPAAYTPGHLAGRIRTSRAAIEGERKQVTILFADVKGSLELLADRDPEEARQILDPVLERMMEAVHYYEGTVNQVLGDGIMALFGAPLAHEDHAVRACYAALRMQESIARYAADLRAADGAAVEVRVGLNSGQVVVRSIGNDLTMDYSAVGQSTHLAARMEQLARPGTILLTGATARLAEGYVDVKPEPDTRVKGLAEPVAVFELIGASAVRSRLHAAAARGLTRFIGREAELAHLGQALAQACGGHGQLVAVAGEPGVGKSRLVWEFLHTARAEGWRALEAAAVSYGRERPYLPVIALVRGALGLTAADALDARQRVAAALGADAPARLASPLLALVDAPLDDARWATLDPDERRRRTLEAVRHLLLTLAHRTPTCVVVEDLHWLDAETQAVLDSLVEGLPTARLLLIVTYRPEYQHGWGGRTYYGQVRIDPLAADGAQQLLDALLGADPALDPLKARLIERTEGNPFFLEESARNLIETGALAGTPGAYRATAAARAAEVPATVQAVLAARIDRLEPDDKHLLQAAAAIGKDVPAPLLRAVSEAPAALFEQGLARLRAGEFLYESRLFPEVEYTFKHALTLEVALGSLLREHRRRLDALIVEAIEHGDPERRAEQIDRLAHHALRGEVWDKALAYCREAGERAAARSAHRAAARSFEQALEALGHLPDTRETREHGVDIRLALRYSLSPLGEFARMLEELQRAEQLAQDLGDQARLGRVCSFLTNLFTVMVEFDRAIEYGRRALAIAEAERDRPLAVVTHTLLALAHYGRGQYREAVELTRRNVTLLADDAGRERYGMALPPAVHSRAVAAWAMAEVGDFTDGAALGREALALSEAAEHGPYSVVFASVGLGTLHLRQGDFDLAIEVLERARALAHAADALAVSAQTAAPLAAAYARSGRPAQARAVLEAAIDQAVAMGDPFGHWLRTGGIAEVLLHEGNAAEALPLARRAVDVTRFAKARGMQAWASWLVGEAAAGLDAEEAERAYRDALGRAETTGMRPLAAHCRLGLGLLRRAAGCGDDARAELAAAREAFEAMGMRHWAERARVASSGQP